MSCWGRSHKGIVQCSSPNWALQEFGAQPIALALSTASPRTRAPLATKEPPVFSKVTWYAALARNACGSRGGWTWFRLEAVGSSILPYWNM